jgi:hypothetical protein
MPPLRRLTITLLLTMAALLGATGAQASDACLQMDGSTFIAKNFKAPSKNHCSPFYGFLDFSAPGQDTVQGSACTSADGAGIHFTIQKFEHVGANIFVTNYLVNVPLPIGAGTFYAQYPVGTKVTGPASFSSKCGPIDVP